MSALAEALVAAQAAHPSTGVKVKLAEYGRARWLTPQGGTTTKWVHALVTHEVRAQEIASHLAADNPGTVEWAKAEKVLP